MRTVVGDRRRLHAAQRQDQERHDEDGVVERQNSEQAPREEAGVMIRGFLGVEEDPGDEEAAQHEEQLHAHPAGADAVRELAADQRVGDVHATEHVGDDEKNRQAAKPVEGGKMCGQ